MAASFFGADLRLAYLLPTPNFAGADVKQHSVDSHNEEALTETGREYDVCPSPHSLRFLLAT